jgi:hypothetical protein
MLLAGVPQRQGLSVWPLCASGRDYFGEHPRFPAISAYPLGCHVSYGHLLAFY